MESDLEIINNRLKELEKAIQLRPTQATLTKLNAYQTQPLVQFAQTQKDMNTALVGLLQLIEEIHPASTQKIDTFRKLLQTKQPPAPSSTKKAK